MEEEHENYNLGDVLLVKKQRIHLRLDYTNYTPASLLYVNDATLYSKQTMMNNEVLANLSVGAGLGRGFGGWGLAC